MSEKRHYKDYFESSVLNDGDFDRDKDVVVKIVKAQDMKISTRDGDLVTLCAMLEGFKLPFRINSTVGKSISKALKTPYPDDWAGKYISVYILKDLRAFGDIHDVPRVRPVAPRIPVASPPVTAEQLKSIREGFTKIGKDEAEYCTQAKIAKLEDLNQERAIKVITWLSGQVKK